MKKTFPKEVYLNGSWLAHDKAFVSVFDRGYLLGDGIYEVIPVYEGKPYEVFGHLKRFQKGLDTVQIAFDVQQLKPLITESIRRAGLEHSDAAIYIQVTRGVAPRTHFFPENVPPGVLLYAYPITLKGFEEKRASTIVTEDVRWHRCDIKSISLMANVLANNEAHKSGVTENILARNGYVTEGSHTSVFFVKDGVLYTHPEGHHILPGVTRNVVLSLCRELSLTVREEAVNVGDIASMDEIFLTGTTVQITGVTSLSIAGEEVYSVPEPGPVTRRLQKAFVQRVVAETRIT